MCVCTLLAAAFSPAAGTDPLAVDPSPATIGAIQVSSATLNLFLARDVDYRSEVKWGDQQLGSAHSTGRASIELVPDPTASTLRIHLDGTATWRTSPALPDSPQPLCDYRAQQQISVHPTAIDVSPARVDALKWNSEPLSQTGESVYEQLWGQLRQLQDRRISARIEQNMDQQVRDVIKVATERVGSQPWIPPAAFKALAPQLRLSTSGTHLYACLVADAQDGPAIPHDSCPLDPTMDVQIVLHESAVAWLATELFGGRYVPDQQVLRHVTRMRGNAPWELWVHSRRAPWSFTWHPQHPVSVSLTDGQAHVVLRGSKVEIGDDYFPAPFEVRASFRPEVSPSPHFHRIAGPTVHVDMGRSSGNPKRLVDHLQQKFAAVLAADVYFDGLHPPVGGSWNKFRCFELVEFTTKDSWFVVAFRQSHSAEHGTSAPSQ